MKSKFYCFLFLSVVSTSISYSQWAKVGNTTLDTYDLGYGGALASKGGVIWAGIHDLWKSVDTGTTWVKTNLSIGGDFVADINFFDRNNGVVAVYNEGVFLTRDGGNTWSHILSVSDCLGVAFNRTSNEILVADRANLGGAASYTSDGGVTWKKQLIETNGGAYQVLSRSDGRAYILSRSVTPLRESHVYESLDFGVTWNKHLTGVDLDSYSFAIDSCNSKKIYIGNEEYNEIDNGSSEIYSSIDEGDTWKSVNQQQPRFFSSACAVSPNAVFAASSLGSGVYRSTDGGITWISIGGPVFHQDSRMITTVNDNILFASDDNGNIWRTINSGGFPISPSKGSSGVPFSTSTTSRINEDTVGANIIVPIYLKVNGVMPSFDMVVHYPPLQLKYIASFTNSNKSIDVAGGQWAGRAEIHFDAADLAARHDSLIGFSVFQQLPGDTNCANVILDSATEIVAQPCIASTVIIAPAATSIIGAPKLPDIKFSISSDRVINDSLGVTVRLPIYLQANAAMPSLDMVIHYPTYSLTYQKSVALSGADVDVAGGAWAGRAAVHFDTAELAARADSLIGYAIFTWYPYEYECAHITFDSMSAHVPDNPCSGKIAVFDTATEGIIGSFPSCGKAIETDVDAPEFQVRLDMSNGMNGIYGTDTLVVNDGRSTDEGLRSITWIAQRGTDTNKIKVLPITPPILSCYTDKINHTVRVVQIDTSAYGCYNFTFTDCLGHQSYDTICMGTPKISGVEGGESLAMSLEANHPNPFSHVTTFTFTIADYGSARLYLYDELGKESARIADGIMPAGRYTKDFDGSNLPSGNYVARLECGGKVVSRRVVVER